MHYALLCGYNNYRNRTYRKSSNLAAYVDASDASYVSTDKDTNFSIEDGIVMNHVFNIKNYTGGEPNYLLLLNKDTDEIESRWFVIDWNKIRGGQYAASLRRDLLADNYEAITKAPCFIEKGYVGPTDSAIFNKEDMTFNQIKTAETILRDDSKTSWIVGYLAQDHQALSNRDFTVNPEVDITINSNHTDWEYADLVDGNEHRTLNITSPESTMRFVIRWVTFTNDFRYEFDFNSSSHSTKRVGPPQVQDFWSVNNGQSYLDSNWYSGINWNTCMDKVFLDNPSWVTTSD